jgi:cytokinin trans-hydroxylase
MPFGAGPHQCIGQHFALLEARLILAVLLARFRIRLCGDFPAPLAGITLRPAGAVPVQIEAR